MASVGYSVEKSREFKNAAHRGDLAAVMQLSQDPQVNVNWNDENGRNALHESYWLGSAEVVKFLLGLEGLDLNHQDIDGVTPLLLVCDHGQVEAASVLLADQRVDVNIADHGNQSPLWRAAYWGHLPLVERMLASGRPIDTKIISTGPLGRNTTAVQVARMEENDSVADLIEAFDRNPVEVTMELRRKLGFQEFQIGKLFALMVLFTDGYLAPVEDNAKGDGSLVSKEGDGVQRFFRIAATLPMDLQMVLCHRVFGSAGCIVKTTHSEPGFQEFARK